MRIVLTQHDISTVITRSMSMIGITSVPQERTGDDAIIIKPQTDEQAARLAIHLERFISERGMGEHMKLTFTHEDPAEVRNIKVWVV